MLYLTALCCTVQIDHLSMSELLLFKFTALYDAILAVLRSCMRTQLTLQTLVAGLMACNGEDDSSRYNRSFSAPDSKSMGKQ